VTAGSREQHGADHDRDKRDVTRPTTLDEPLDGPEQCRYQRGNPGLRPVRPHHMKPDVAKMKTGQGCGRPAEVQTAQEQYVPPTATMISNSFTNAGASHSGSTK